MILLLFNYDLMSNSLYSDLYFGLHVFFVASLSISDVYPYKELLLRNVDNFYNDEAVVIKLGTCIVLFAL